MLSIKANPVTGGWEIISVWADKKSWKEKLVGKFETSTHFELYELDDRTADP